MPATLSYYGTIQAEEGIPFPAANYVTTNPINDGAFIWVPVGSKVMFKNTSGSGAESYKWIAPGADVDDDSATDLIAVYSTAGTYEFPTLTANYATGESKFAHDLKIKVGGQAELCHSDTRKWGTTYGLGHAPFDNDGGYLGGSNDRNIAAVGNFYRFSSPDMYVDGVNIYSGKKAQNVSADSYVKVRIYLPYLGQSSFSMVGQFGALGALELDNIPMTNYKTTEDGAYLPSKDFGVYTMSISRPMNCEGYPYLFFAVEGFVSEPNVKVTEDFVIATDVLPGRALALEDYSDALSHNSFVRQNGESDFLRPVSVFGGSSFDIASNGWKSYNFWICPVVRGAETPFTGIEDIVVDSAKTELELTREGDCVTITGVKDGQVSVYGLNGVCELTAQAANGGVIFNISALGKGVHIVRTAEGSTAKFVK